MVASSFFSKFAAAAVDDVTLLRQECDALLKDAVRRPYGVGWEHTFTNAQGATPRLIWNGQCGTPAAGLLLLRAGKLLDEPKYTQVGIETARGLVASQDKSGRFPKLSLFAVNAGTQDKPATPPDRLSTRAAVALLIAVTERPPATNPANGVAPESIKRAAIRGAQWLMKQRGSTGAWPSIYETGATALEHLPIMRLDQPDFHESTLTLLLAGQTFDLQPLVNGARSSVGLFERMRVSSPRDYAALWGTAYVPDGSVFQRFPDQFVPGPDLIASRNVMATLLSYRLLTDDSAFMPHLAAAAVTIRRFQQTNGMWERHLRAENPNIDTEGGIFNPASAPSTREARDYGTFDLEPMLAALEEMETTGIGAFRQRANAPIPIREQIASALVGLERSPIDLTLPRSEEGVDAFLNRPAMNLRENVSSLERRLTFIHRLIVRIEVQRWRDKEN